ncbi:MAG: 1-(5-phosphoribosyl)-5-[(5-phosphoribosylamino)methylideneamino]imidazole-4-carboxamide isomerase [Alphaproteobacteria bacterium]|nr:MAG: 1-(5-phosphoribosyl)-5-[(5-phosphoribosylamino)methylideneamino]imidazole-4-carboxamide isomerase [Alphaproteobacteria bacterium]
MILFPAIDLKNGQCVRLERGAMDSATVFNADPADQAARFAAAGAAWLHVVDLDGAFAGRPVNAQAVRGILAATALPVQLGGGIRRMNVLEAWINLGVRRAVLGTAALKDPLFVREAARAWPGQIVVAVDARDGKVAVEGWAESTEIAAVDLARRFEDVGVAALLFTDVERDGALAGVNWQATLELAAAVTIPVIASGGVAGIDDLRRLARGSAAAQRPLEGVVVGRALYDGRLDLAAALACLRDETAPTC